MPLEVCNNENEVERTVFQAAAENDNTDILVTAIDLGFPVEEDTHCGTAGAS